MSSFWGFGPNPVSLQVPCCGCWCLHLLRSTGALCCRAEQPETATLSPRASLDRSPSWSLKLVSSAMNPFQSITSLYI